PGAVFDGRTKLRQWLLHLDERRPAVFPIDRDRYRSDAFLQSDRRAPGPRSNESGARQDESCADRWMAGHWQFVRRREDPDAEIIGRILRRQNERRLR